MQKIIFIIFVCSCQIEIEPFSKQEYCNGFSCDGKVTNNEIYCSNKKIEVPDICSCIQNKEKVVCYDK